MKLPRKVLESGHALPLGFLCALALIFHTPVLFTDQVLLPGAMLKGFAPFGSDPQAAWNLLQWDALGQYYPWRAFSARELAAGNLPLWNPYQFSGAPFIANGQSAVFYPPNLLFLIFDTARAFGIAAFLHTLLAAWSTYFLAQHWKLSRSASTLAALGYAFCGYLAAWVMLPTLAQTASWLPLCLLLFERAVEAEKPNQRLNQKLSKHENERSFGLPVSLPLGLLVLLSLALCCALFAGHAQIFFYILVALFLRALFLGNVLRGLSTLALSLVLTLMMGAIQLLPTLELARNGHRAGAKPSLEGWNFLVPRALQTFDLPSLFIAGWPQLSFAENFGYVGVGVLVLATAGILFFLVRRSGFDARRWGFAVVLAAFGILYALATPLAQAFYFWVPGLAQMGGVGRALIFWSLGIALLAGFGWEAVRRRWSTPALALVAGAILFAELLVNGISARSTAPRAQIYPATPVTDFLRTRTGPQARALFITPRASWLPVEVLGPGGRTHPPGVLPPNGAIVYGIYDVNGYDSLAPRAYREFVAPGENLKPDEDISPPLNGNMILLQNPNSPALEQLGLRYVVTQSPLDDTRWKEVLRAAGCIVYERVRPTEAERDGSAFSPGWRDGKYQPESFRFGGFLTLCALMLCGFIGAAWYRSKSKP